jgi:hypothetical protein
MFIKIDNDIFQFIDISVQLSITKKATIFLEIDIENNQNYYTYFIDKYEKKRSFVIEHSKYIAKGCRIKTIDIVFNSKISLNISCQHIDTDISEIRDSVIEQILKEK